MLLGQFHDETAALDYKHRKRHTCSILGNASTQRPSTYGSDILSQGLFIAAAKCERKAHSAFSSRPATDTEKGFHDRLFGRAMNFRTSLSFPL